MGRMSWIFAIATCVSAIGSEAPAQIRDVGQVGGDGGRFFDFPCSNNTEIGAIEVFGGNFIDSIRICTRAKGSEGCAGFRQAGGNGGAEQIFLVFNRGEFITAITGRAGNFVDSIGFGTSQHGTPHAGGPGGQPYTFTTFPDEEICGIFGKAGNFVDSLGVHIRKR